MTVSSAFIVKRVLQAIATIVALAVLNFILLSLAPGDVIDALIAASGAADEGLADTLREQYGIAGTRLGQLYQYVVGLTQFNMGYSISLGQPVSEAISTRLGPTLILMVGAVTLALVLGVTMGLLAGWRHGSYFDRILSIVSLLGYAVPLFWLGLLMILLFSVKLNLLPTGGMRPVGPAKPGLEGVLDIARHAILPIVTLAFYYLAIFARVMRSSVIEVKRMDFIKTARSKGMTETRLLTRHVLGNAFLPVLTMLGLQVAGLLGGAVVIETIFGWPGLGRLAFDAIFSRDITLLMGILFLSSVVVVLTNLVIDILYGLLDPRIEMSGGRS